MIAIKLPRISFLHIHIIISSHLTKSEWKEKTVCGTAWFSPPLLAVWCSSYRLVIVRWLPCICQLNSRLIWLQIHHRYISLCWVSLMPHFKHGGGTQKGMVSKPTPQGADRKWKKRHQIPPSFLSPWQILYVPTSWKTGVRESKVIKGRHLKKKEEDETMSVTQRRANEGMEGREQRRK